MMAERSAASSAAAGFAAFCRAIKRIGIPDGDFSSAGAFGTNENPVSAPLTLRLTSAVTCSHQGRLMGGMESPHSSLHDKAATSDETELNTGATSVIRRQMFQDGLNLWTTGVLRVREQRGCILGCLGACADDPPLVDVGDKGSLPGRGGHRPSTQARKALVRGNLRRSGVAQAVGGVALEPLLHNRLAIVARHRGPADDVVYGSCGHCKAVDRVGR